MRGGLPGNGVPLIGQPEPIGVVIPHPGDPAKRAYLPASAVFVITPEVIAAIAQGLAPMVRTIVALELQRHGLEPDPNWQPPMGAPAPMQTAGGTTPEVGEEAAHDHG